ncbi:MAG: ATP-dependent DNA helicase PcrA [Candidatus Delongbacteria bacterium]|nr:MAG: ATP-dependent DNA helicase PcrA [Candidatus Delongbacteria bacterium]
MDLNDKQNEAVDHLYNPLLVLAGAGSGKTRVIINRIARLISKEKISPSSILAVTFTNKAAKELKNRLYNLIGIDAKFVHCGTFHSICLQILREFKESAGFNGNFSIYDTDDKVKLIKVAIRDLGLDDKVYKPKIVGNIISKLKNRLIYPESYEPKSDNVRDYHIKEIYRRYQELIEANDGCDFDDIISKTVLMLHNNEDISFEIQNRYQFIHVDEYQDTNFSQEIFIETISKTFNNLFVVGDEDQSIYSWRGAEVSNILNFCDKYRKSKLIRLEKNYRSTKNILKGANDIIKHNSKRLGKTLFTENEEGSPIVLKSYDYDTEEADDLIKTLNNLKESGYSFRDTAVLYRVNSISRTIEDRLRKNSIPYRIFGGVKFYERKEIKDITAYLNLLLNQNDNLSFERVINFPPRGIGKESIKKIKQFSYKNSSTYLRSVQDNDFTENLTPRAKKAVLSFSDLYNRCLEKMKSYNVYDLANFIFKESGMDTYYSKDDDESIERRQNIEEFLSGIKEYMESNEDSSLLGFLQSVALLTDLDKFNESEDSITLMTVHSSKGLEFKNIIICGANDGIFPSFRSIQEGDIEEERRLFYVAMTRAEENLFIYSYKFNRFGATYDSSPPSRFIENLNEDYINASEFNRGDRNPRVKRERVIVKPKIEKVKFEKGSWVTHDQFGDGKIIVVEEHKSGVAYVIDFEDYGPKKLLAKYAKLRKFEAD